MPCSNLTLLRNKTRIIAYIISFSSAIYLDYLITSPNEAVPFVIHIDLRRPVSEFRRLKYQKREFNY